MNIRDARRKILRCEDQGDLDVVAERIASNGFSEDERSELRAIWLQRKMDLANGETVGLRTRCSQIAARLRATAVLDPTNFVAELKAALEELENANNQSERGRTRDTG